MTVAPFAPVLSADGDPDISWLYPHTQPAQWRVEQSADGVTAWTQNALEPSGTSDSHACSAGLYFRVVGVTAGNVISTQYSNVVLQT